MALDGVLTACENCHSYRVWTIVNLHISSEKKKNHHVLFKEIIIASYKSQDLQNGELQGNTQGVHNLSGPIILVLLCHTIAPLADLSVFVLSLVPGEINSFLNSLLFSIDTQFTSSVLGWKKQF